MKECVASYCPNLGSLSVWFSMQPFCYPTTSDAVSGNVVSRRMLTESDHIYYVHSMTVGAFSFIAASAGIILGTIIGRRKRAEHFIDPKGEYHQICTDDTDASLQFKFDR